MHAMNLLFAGCDHRRVRTVTRLFSLVALISSYIYIRLVMSRFPFFLFFPLFFFPLRLKDELRVKFY